MTFQQSPSNWIILILVGKIILYLIQQFPLPEPLTKYKTIVKLHECDLCGGVHVYALMSFVMSLYLLTAVGIDLYIPVVSEYITGGIISFLVHIFSLGWKEKFSNIVVV